MGRPQPVPLGTPQRRPEGRVRRGTLEPTGGGPTTGTSGRFWGIDLSPAASDMEIEAEGEGSRKRRMSQETRDCSVFLAPLPAPPEKGGKGKKKKKR